MPDIDTLLNGPISQENPRDRAWRAYCEGGPSRTFLAAQNATGIALDTIRGWAIQGGWEVAARAWDRAVEDARRVEGEQALSGPSADGEHVLLARGALAIARRELAKLEAESRRSAGPIVGIRDLVRLIREVADLERLIRGQTTAGPSALPVSDVDTTRIAEGDLRACLAVLDRARYGSAASNGPL